MSLYCIAKIKKGSKIEGFRLIDIDSSDGRYDVNGDTFYRYIDASKDRCEDKIIGGLTIRTDKIHGFRTDTKLPCIDQLNPDSITNRTTIMKCSERIFVNYEGRRIKYKEREKYHIENVVDIRLPHQKFVENGIKGAKIKYSEEDKTGAIRTITIRSRSRSK